MKKTLFTTIILGSLLYSSVSLGTTVFAAEVASRNTDAQIIFEENDETTGPVDPIDPEKPVGPIDPIDPEKPVDPGTPGPLSLDFASSLNFGKQKITSTDKTYFAASQKVKEADGTVTEKPNYVQLTDNRGTLAGWSLSVKQDGQFKTDSGKALTGAKITFMNGQKESISESTAPATVKNEFDLTSDGTGAQSNVFAAQNDQGAGTWIYRFGDESNHATSIKLDVPGKTTKVKDSPYKTKIVWTLSDMPSNGNGGGTE